MPAGSPLWVASQSDVGDLCATICSMKQFILHLTAVCKMGSAAVTSWTWDKFNVAWDSHDSWLMRNEALFQPKFIVGQWLFMRKVTLFACLISTCGHHCVVGVALNGIMQSVTQCRSRRCWVLYNSKILWMPYVKDVLRLFTTRRKWHRSNNHISKSWRGLEEANTKKSIVSLFGMGYLYHRLFIDSEGKEAKS